MEKNSTSSNKHTRKGGVLNAIVLLAVGVILLLNNFGLIDWNVWMVLWKFWPLMLILWGLKEIAGQSFFFNLIFGLVGTALVTFAVVYSLALTNKEFRNWLETRYPYWTNILQIETKPIQRIKTV